MFVPLADDALKQAVSIKLLRRELTIAMPCPSPAMQSLSAKSLLKRRNLVAVK
jgi:hypothetical protein